MCDIQALSSETIEIKCDDGNQIQISTNDRVRFRQSYNSFSEGEIVSVEPHIDMNENYYLKMWGKNKPIKILREDGIKDLICNKRIISTINN